MLRQVLAALLLICAPALHAQDSALHSLETGYDAAGWEAVGRLDIDGKGFCTAALIGERRVLTAAHCLYDTATGAPIDPDRMEFLAGLRNGRALAYRGVRRAVPHPDYMHDGTADLDNVMRDVAILELSQPIRSTRILPFPIGHEPRPGGRVGIVSYALDRAEAPSLQETCTMLGQQSGVFVMSCDVDFGSSGAPIFSTASGRTELVSVVSAKAEMDRDRVALGMSLAEPLARIEQSMAAGGGSFAGTPPSSFRVVRPGEDDRSSTGAKFIRP